MLVLRWTADTAGPDGGDLIGTGWGATLVCRAQSPLADDDSSSLFRTRWLGWRGSPSSNLT